MANVYFDPTCEFNRHEPVAVLSSGQAVVYYRIAIMSKDGDRMQQADRRRVAAYQQAAAPYLDEFRRLGFDGLPLDQAHDRMCTLAEARLPEQPPGV